MSRGEDVSGAEVVSIRRDQGALQVVTTNREVAASFLINCAGLYADVVAWRLGLRPKIQIVPSISPVLWGIGR